MRSIGLFTMALTFICLLAAGLGGCDPTQTQETELGHHDHLAASNHQTPLLIDHETVLRFQRDWNTVASNLPVMAGGRLRVEYDPVRLPHCRATYNGAPAWNITMSYRSLPDGQTHQARLQPHGNMLMVVVPVPETGQDLELTFNNTDRQGCRAEDTNLNQRYRFQVSKPDEVATLVFDPSWSAESTRPLEQGGLMRIQYAPDRLRTCRATYNGGRTWTPDSLEREVASYFDAHTDIDLMPAARKTEHTFIWQVSAYLWEVQQVIIDPEGDNDWALKGRVDLDQVDDWDGPLVELLGLSL